VSISWIAEEGHGDFLEAVGSEQKTLEELERLLDGSINSIILGST
jgi:hypothetical protein